jgi:hypothetical protein
VLVGGRGRDQQADLPSRRFGGEAARFAVKFSVAVIRELVNDHQTP